MSTTNVTGKKTSTHHPPCEWTTSKKIPFSSLLSLTFTFAELCLKDDKNMKYMFIITFHGCLAMQLDHFMALGLWNISTACLSIKTINMLAFQLGIVLEDLSTLYCSKLLGSNKIFLVPRVLILARGGSLGTRWTYHKTNAYCNDEIKSDDQPISPLKCFRHSLPS